MNIAGDESLPPLLLFHGVGDDSALMWVYNAKALSQKMRLYAVDTLGGPGRSVPNAGYDRDFDDEAWLIGLMDQLGLDQANVAGVSHGGYLAQLLAMRRPDRVRRIACLAAATPTGKGSPMKTMLKIFMPEAAFPTKRNTTKLLTKLSGENAAAFTQIPLILDHFTALLRGYNNMAMGYHKVLCFEEAQITAIRDKALYLAGDRDPFMLYGGKQAIQKLGMNARFYPSAGHGLNHELPDVIDQALIDWFL